MHTLTFCKSYSFPFNYRGQLVRLREAASRGKTRDDLLENILVEVLSKEGRTVDVEFNDLPCSVTALIERDVNEFIQTMGHTL